MEIFPKLKVTTVLSYISTLSFIVMVHTLRFMISFKLMFLCNVRQEFRGFFFVLFCFVAHACPSDTASLIKRVSFPTELPWHLSENPADRV